MRSFWMDISVQNMVPLAYVVGVCVVGGRAPQVSVIMLKTQKKKLRDEDPLSPTERGQARGPATA